MKLVLKTVQPRQGIEWLRLSVQTFLRAPMGLTAMFGLFLLFALVALVLPIVGGFLVISAIPLLGLGMMLATAAALRDKPIGPALYLMPLRGDPERRKPLLVLCALYGTLTLLVLLLSESLDGGKLLRLQELLAGESRGPEVEREVQRLLADGDLAAGLYARLGLTALLSIPFWHAPALVWWGRQGVAQSLFSSTLALWRTKAAFALYLVGWCALLGAGALVVGLLGQALGSSSLIALLVMPLGLLVSVLFYISLYFMFVQTFSAVGITDDDAPNEPDEPVKTPDENRSADHETPGR